MIQARNMTALPSFTCSGPGAMPGPLIPTNYTKAIL